MKKESFETTENVGKKNVSIYAVNVINHFFMNKKKRCVKKEQTVPPLEKKKHRCAGRIMITQLSKKKRKRKKTKKHKTPKLEHNSCNVSKGISREINGNSFFPAHLQRSKCSRMQPFSFLIN